MKQFGAESLENKAEEAPTLESEFERLQKIIAVLKNMNLTLTKDAEDITAEIIKKEDFLESDFCISLIKEGG